MPPFGGISLWNVHGFFTTGQGKYGILWIQSRKTVRKADAAAIAADIPTA